MGNARAICVTAADESLAIDPVQGGKSGAGIIEGKKGGGQSKQKAVRGAGAVDVSSDHEVTIVIPKEERGRRSGRVERKGQGAVGIAEEAVIDHRAIEIGARDLGEAVNGIAYRVRTARDGEGDESRGDAGESLVGRPGDVLGARGIARVVERIGVGIDRARLIDLCEDPAGKEVTMGQVITAVKDPLGT